MSIRILHDSYGKSRVRIIKVARTGPHHDMQDLTLNIALEGDFEDIHKTGDNSNCLPTDTMKNTVYAMAGQIDQIEQAEDFGRRLARHFITTNAQVSLVRLEIAENRWVRMEINGELHDHSFIKGGREKRLVNLTARRDGMTIDSGVEDLIVLKTTKSGFAGFKKDNYTTLPEVNDRIFATSIKAIWRYRDAESASEAMCAKIRATIIRVFAEHESRSVQHTLYAMGEAVLEENQEVAEISFSLPNVHCLPIDISRFGLQDNYAIFVPTDEPHGLIEATLAR